MDIEKALTIWAERKLRDDHCYRGDEAVRIDHIEIVADPGSDRDDSYAESPHTDIVIDGRVDGRWVRTTVSPDLLVIVRELTAITREES